jgi:hypothetical protein
MSGRGGGVVELVEQGRERVGHGEQAVPEPCVERVPDKGVRPHVVVGQDGQQDVREPRSGVDARGPRAVDRGSQRHHGAAGGEPAQQERCLGMPSGVPDDPAGRYVFQPERGRIGVQVQDCGGTRDREAIWQPVPQV